MLLQDLFVTLPLLASIASAQCYSGVNIFQARGTGESRQGSLSDLPANYTLKAIPDSHLTRVLYSANLTWGPSIHNGTVMMSNMVNDYHKQCPDSKIVLEGYSQGAIVTGNALDGADDQVPAFSEDVGRQIVAIVQYGDPGYQANQSYARADCAKSPAGTRNGEPGRIFDSYSSKIVSYCHAQDPVCCAGGNMITAHVSYFTNDNAQEVADFVKKQYDASGSSGNDTAVQSGSSSAGPAQTATGGAAASTGAASGTASDASPTEVPGSGAAAAGTPTAPSQSPTETGAASRVAFGTAGYSLSAMLLVALML